MLDDAVAMAQAGKQVMVITRHGPWQYFYGHETDDQILRVYRTAGHERVQYKSGGTLRFAKTSTAARGWVADAIYAPMDKLHDTRFNADIMPCLATSIEGSITYSTIL